MAALYRHNQHGRPGCNVGFADGHIEFVSAERIAELKWKPNE
jgi:prepilin-type processing-associated H-X9-DG protein